MHSIKVGNLIVLTIPTSLFSYDERSRTFHADASDLQGKDRPQRINPDNFELGIALQSHLTGNVELFRHSQIIRYPVENELLGWKYESVTEGLNVSVIILND